MNWFESTADIERIGLSQLERVDRPLAENVAGPSELSAGEWIVKLTHTAANSVRSLNDIDDFFREANSDLRVISGLGSAGLILVRGEGTSRADIEGSLRSMDTIDSFSLNQMIEGQLAANDSDFQAGQLAGLQRSNVDTAWDVTIGSSSTVVGIVDTGIDPTHRDLFLNIWINQGELSPLFRSQLVDIDDDGVISFYDLNNATRSAVDSFSVSLGGFATGPNSGFVRDLNQNGFIDAKDLLQDANWADGRDTDNNGFSDDIFGVNFRSGSGDPFASNNPSDELGHGTHVAGTVGAIGGNSVGVVGVNWQTSLMSLRILDNNNQGDTGAAIRAINYATQMRERYQVNSSRRVVQGANVRVLNNSWGQPGGFESSLETAIRDSYEAGILFVAAAGNGNILGQGVDNDRTPFYPASYDVPNVISVAAADIASRLAEFSNYGRNSVDLVAPGIGIRSTIPNNGYSSANGTSMATPHVSGTAALVWSALPEATVDEVREAILSSAVVVPALNELVSTSGRLSAFNSLNADVFAPSAKLEPKSTVSVAGGPSTQLRVTYSHRTGISEASIGADDIKITRQWGPNTEFSATLLPNSVSSTPTTTTATYVLNAPGGSWDVLDFGDYVVSTNAGGVLSAVGNQQVEAREIGRFQVRILDPSVTYVTRTTDSTQSSSLRTAIQAANVVAPAPRTIIMEAGSYLIEVPPIADPNVNFLLPTGRAHGIVETGFSTTWSNGTTGDFDVFGNITIIGDSETETVINGGKLDRLFKVHPTAELNLRNVTLEGGLVTGGQPGGAILSAGLLNITDVTLRGNLAEGTASQAASGGAIASVAGTLNVQRALITDNVANASAGIALAGNATGTVTQSTIDSNRAINVLGESTYGSGVGSYSSNDLAITNSTINRNTGVAVHAGTQYGSNDSVDRFGESISTSASGRFTVFSSGVSNLVAGDTNKSRDVFLHDIVLNTLTRISLNVDGREANGDSYQPQISSDASTIVFVSNATNLIPNANNDGSSKIYVYRRATGQLTHASVRQDGTPIERSDRPSISANGRYLAFQTYDDGLVPGDSNPELFSGNTFDSLDVYRKDLQTGAIQLVSAGSDGLSYKPLADSSYSSSVPSISHDGQRIAFRSTAMDLDGSIRFGQRPLYLWQSTSTVPAFITSDATGTAISGDGSTLVYSRSGLVRAYQIATGFESLVGRNPSSILITSQDFFPSVSTDGNVVALIGSENGSSGRSNAYVINRTTESVKRIQHLNPPDDQSEQAAVSSNGARVVFYSFANNLVPGDTTTTRDVFNYLVSTEGIIPITSPPSNGKIRLINNTIAFNASAVTASGRIEAGNTLFVGNTATEAIAKSGTSLGNNLYDVPSGPQNPTDRVDPTAASKLGALTVFPGFKPAYPLLRGSLAINAGAAALAPSNDQRGANRPAQVDIGSVETVDAVISGTLFIDKNGNDRLDREESGLAGVRVFLDTNRNGKLDPNETSVLTSADDPSTLENEVGRYELSNLVPGEYGLAVVTPPQFLNEPDSFLDLELLGGPQTGLLSRPSISRDGQRIAFESTTSNQVPGAENNSNIYVFDRTSVTPTLITGNVLGVQDSHAFNPSISDDGKRVAYSLFQSFGTAIWYADFGNDLPAQNTSIRVADGQSSMISGDGNWIVVDSEVDLIGTDNNGLSDVYLFNVESRAIKLISKRFNSTSTSTSPGDGASGQSFISRDGRFIVFSSTASDLVDGDTNGKYDLFVFDNTTNLVSRVPIGPAGISQTGFNAGPTISDDGRFVVFDSDANDLVAGDTNNQSDIFLVDRNNATASVMRLTAGVQQFDGNSYSPMISGDGNHIVFDSAADNLLATAGTSGFDVFVYDRLENQYARFSLESTGDRPAINRDGSLVGYRMAANRVGITRNPLEPFVTNTNVLPGDRVTLNLGIVAANGSITGTLYNDLVKNETFDVEEPRLSGWRVYIDSNRDGKLNEGETSTRSDSDGVYRFNDLPSLTEYAIGVVAPVGWETIAPDAKAKFQQMVTLGAGATVNNRDFGFREVTSTGQSRSSLVSGRLYDDRNNNRIFDAGDVAWAGREVFLDAANPGVRDVNEPRVLTDDQGIYTIANLGAQNIAVTTTLDQTLTHVTPLGSDFKLQTYPLFGGTGIRAFSGSQAIAKADFNGDEFLDVAIALGEANLISIRLNDGKGGFVTQEIDLPTGSDGVGPGSIVVENFDSDPRLDVAVTANLSGKVIVMLNYDNNTKKFTSRQAITVGAQPVDIVAGQFAGDSALDLVIVNKVNRSSPGNSTLQILTNNGSGSFVAGTPILAGGKNSVSIVTADFNGDNHLDIAVTHSAPLTSGVNGGLTILNGNGAGGLTLQTPYYTLGTNPIDSVVGHFNKDGRPDIVVSNFNSNSISVLLGQTDGTLRVQNQILGTSSGAYDIAVGDIDNDSDIDVISSNLVDRNISIFRNAGIVNNEVQFEPLENVGVSLLSFLAKRMPIVVGNFDNDRSGPGGSETLDIVTIPQATDALHVLTNRLVNGARRVSLTGVNQAPNLDFIIKPTVLLPSFNAIPNPEPMVEDAATQTIIISGVTKGRSGAPGLRFSATSSATSIIPNPSITHTANSDRATLRYTPAANANGTVVITVVATDAGFDGVFDGAGSADNGTFSRSFTVTVRPSNDPPTFNVPSQISASQKAALQTLPGFATGLGKGGGADETPQTLSDFVIATSPAFFSVQPTITADGTLRFRPSSSRSGAVTVAVTRSDNGGRDNGGQNSTTKTFVIDVLPVNDRPSFSILGHVSARADAGARTVTGFATNFTPGGGIDEATQTISGYVISVDKPELFSVQPSVDKLGTLRFTPAADRSGLAVVSLQVRDTGGQANGGVDLSIVRNFNITVTPAPDTKAPLPVITPTVPARTNKTVFDVNVDFGEAVTGFTLADIVAVNGTPSSLVNLSGGKFRFVFTGNSGTIRIAIRAAAAKDLAGNDSLAAVSIARIIDVVGPSTTLSTTAPNPTRLNSFSASVRFGEPVSGMTLSDIAVVGGTASNLVTVDAATGTYSATITPTRDGTLVVFVPANAVFDAAGNGNLASAALERLVDRTAPIAVLSTSQPNLSNRASFTVFADFGEAVSGLAQSDFLVSGATAGVPALIAPGRYSILFNAVNGPVTISLPSGAVRDLASNASPTSNSLSLTVDLKRPTPTLTAVPATAIGTFVVTVAFDEAVSDFIAEDLVLSNGTITSFSGSGQSYRVVVKRIVAAPLTVSLPQGRVSDSVGNQNLASNLLTLTSP